MEIQELERKLQKHEMYGFTTPTASPDYLGWILVGRRLQAPGTLEDEEPGSRHYAALLKISQENPETYRRIVDEKRDVQERPFLVLILEVDKAVHESGDYLDGEDYGKREVYYFKSLQEVEQLLNQLGYSIADIKSMWEINSP